MRIRLFAVLALLPLCAGLHAVDYASTGSTTEQCAQMRVGAEFTKKWKCGLRLHIGEELRFDLMDNATGITSKEVAVDTAYGPAFAKSYTTLALGYAPVQYFKMDAGYTLRILGRKSWNDYNEFLRHRVFFGVTGSYKMQYAKIYLRERAVLDMRTDSVNLDEKNRYNWLLRSRLGADFYVQGQPLTPYLWVELENTLNAPEYQQKDGHQYISRVRSQAGLKWRISRMSSLNFYYRFTYGYDRHININKNYYIKGNPIKIRLDEATLFQHVIGVSYDLNW
ncbi:MAG: DUF2490 domain-containing protein [Paludibacteraceae bacterium]|nr:DUF2490 domain-containing protein [Paludibacteraceae bacterium]